MAWARIAASGYRRPNAGWPKPRTEAETPTGTVGKMPSVDHAAACPAAPGSCFSLDELRPIGAGLLVFLQDTEPLRDFGVRLDQPAEIAPETVLVELVVRFDVPKATGIGRNLVGDDDAHHIAFPQPAAFHLKIDEPYADAKEKPG